MMLFSRGFSEVPCCRYSARLKNDTSPFLAHAASIAESRQTLRQFIVMTPFKVGDKVSWNSEAGRVCGTVTRIHKRDFVREGYTHHASPDSPQYEIKGSQTEHIAFHKGSALTKIRR